MICCKLALAARGDPGSHSRRRRHSRRGRGRATLAEAGRFLSADCGWPTCFYFTNVYRGNLLKKSFAFTAEQVTQQSLFVSITGLSGYCTERNWDCGVRGEVRWPEDSQTVMWGIVQQRTNGVNTNGVTAIFSFFDIVWVFAAPELSCGQRQPAPVRTAHGVRVHSSGLRISHMSR